MKRSKHFNKKTIFILFASLLVVGAGYLSYLTTFGFGGEVGIPENIVEGIKKALFDNGNEVTTARLFLIAFLLMALLILRKENLENKKELEVSKESSESKMQANNLPKAKG